MMNALEQMFWRLLGEIRKRPSVALHRATVTSTAPLRVRVEGEDSDTAVEPADGHVMAVGRKRILLGGGGSANTDTGWVSFPASIPISSTPQCRVKNGLLHVKGAVIPGADWGTDVQRAIATLPVGMRPSTSTRATAQFNGEIFGTLSASPNGFIYMRLHTATSGAILLSSIPPMPVD